LRSKKRGSYQNARPTTRGGDVRAGAVVAVVAAFVTVETVVGRDVFVAR
jgi:hypothetical protein